MPSNKSSLSDLFDEAKNLVKPIHQRFLDNPNIPGPLQGAMKESVQNGGKYLRPALALACASLFHVPKSQIAQVSAAIEMIHAYSLIHDDLPCMDNSDMRRGLPSCWRQFGEATAILAGDSLLPLAFEILASEATHPSAEIRLTLIQDLSADCGASGMAGGQIMDLSPDLIDSIDKATIMQHLKTGCLIAFSCAAGAILGSTPPSEKQNLRQFGFLFGLAYQIRDDLLDTEGNAQELGKPVGMDSQKRSLVALLGARESKRYLKSLQEEMTRLIEDYQQPLLMDLIDWATTRKA